MNRLALAVGMACAACASSVFGQSDSSLSADATQQPVTTLTSSAVAQNFQYMNHPPTHSAPARSVATSGGGRGHRHRQMSSNPDGGGGASTQP
ncbi:hypothetical protein B0G69_0559 [Paraburkholderia sp. RAU2J]|uniref:hypothetical protein n=1 Tax=Paraburkholderia sp. RAU2J TaxID=1938810 RepID=UPI000F1AA6F5|nr:hypothetical protein [Paraburkholderia sp. RAU2J]RKT24867.1 hypothetical protein B0G69_0559 [Paraburkholderia sp. RAU2J]